MHRKKRLKIAYLCETDPKNKLGHSGGNHWIFNTLQKHVGDVTYIPNHWGILEFVQKFINGLPEFYLMRLRFRVHTLLSGFIAKRYAKELRKDKYDVLFCSFSFFCLANLKLPYPILTVFSSDATFTIYQKSEVGAAFGGHNSIARLFDPVLLKYEEKVYSSIDLLLWPSPWIKGNADSLYGLESGQSHMVPWGANIDHPSAEELNINNPIEGQVRILLVGRDWYHKGGPMVYEVLKALLAQGIDAHFTVVGCVPPPEHTHENMTVHPQLNKSVPEELELMKDLYKNSHFFVMPSYQSYGFAFCEAGAYGLPALCLRVGGVPVYEGKNGKALPKDSTAKDFAEQIVSHINSPETYLNLRKSTRRYYEDNLHWDAWGQKASQLIEQKLDEKFHS